MLMLAIAGLPVSCTSNQLSRPVIARILCTAGCGAGLQTPPLARDLCAVPDNAEAVGFCVGTAQCR